MTRPAVWRNAAVEMLEYIEHDLDEMMHRGASPRRTDAMLKLLDGITDTRHRLASDPLILTHQDDAIIAELETRLDAIERKATALL